jgi:hypothetical protein
MRPILQRSEGSEGSEGGEFGGKTLNLPSTWHAYTISFEVCLHPRMSLAFFPVFIVGLVASGYHGEVPNFFLPTSYCHDCGMVFTLESRGRKPEGIQWNEE